jgi:hypothetical protein
MKDCVGGVRGRHFAELGSGLESRLLLGPTYRISLDHCSILRGPKFDCLRLVHGRDLVV